MKSCFDFVAIVLSMPVLASWAMRPPLVPVQILIGVVLSACMLLFWARSSTELKRQMYDRLYGPGARAVPMEWWEMDLDPIFKGAVNRWSKKWRKQ